MELAAPLPLPAADPLVVPVLPPSYVEPVPLADPAPPPLAAPLADPDGAVVVEGPRRSRSSVADPLAAPLPAPLPAAVPLVIPVLLPSCVIAPLPLAEPEPLPLAEPLAEQPTIALKRAAQIAARKYLLATISTPFEKTAAPVRLIWSQPSSAKITNLTGMHVFEEAIGSGKKL